MSEIDPINIFLMYLGLFVPVYGFICAYGISWDFTNREYNLCMILIFVTGMASMIGMYRL